MALPVGSPLFVTVDGDEDAYRRAVAAVGGLAATVVRVGQPSDGWSGGPFGVRDGRLGVAANKNTGIECMMNWLGESPYPTVEHLFLSDDDSWPLSTDALTAHTSMGLPHSMVCWGMHRQQTVHWDGENHWAFWKWPRGSVLYVERSVIVRCGGMREEFGPGGHEHVEWSRRIHQTFATPGLYPSPGSYADNRATGARRLWHCEDMQQKGEPLGNARIRRRRLTSVRRAPGDWEHIEKIMNEVDGDTSFVPFRAAGNGRLSATMTTTSPA